MTTSTEKTTDLLVAVLTDLAPVVAGVTEQQKNDPTPCSGYDVAQLTDHVTGWLSTFADGFADPAGQAPRASLDGYVPPPDPAAEVRRAAATMEKALRDGAAARPLRLGGSAMPGELALGMILWEYQMHGWDLARATGQPWSPPQAAAEESLAFAPNMLTPDYQGDGKAFADPVPVPADAPAFDRLLGLSGRDPAWSPGLTTAG
ncbi:MAG TPA: TIGR03086 family metal-binding protein [Streptosporangiaceae bacterium]